MTTKTEYYYHAGIERDDDTGEVVWSDHTRRSRAAAEAEARQMATKFGGRAVLECWDRKWGLRPGWDVAESFERVAE